MMELHQRVIGEKYVNYDCGGQNLTNVNEIKDDSNILIVICLEEINDLKEGILLTIFIKK